jgi:6-pyruvoyltetrahydropterin/6-carboxytetrahydropterin synthase
MTTTCTRIFGIDVGHRVMRHESKCAHVHGHRYGIEVTCSAPQLDAVGRVIDFGVVKELVGSWLDDTLDHGYAHHPDDPVGEYLRTMGQRTFAMPPEYGEPTAENLARLVGTVAGELLAGDGIEVTHVRIYETPNCYADWRKGE